MIPKMTKKRNKSILLGITVFFLFLISVPMSYAISLDIDEIIWQEDDGFKGTDLKAIAEISFNDENEDENELLIKLTNDSGNLTPTGDGFPSAVLLTGIGFNLPSGYWIIGGSISGYEIYDGSTLVPAPTNILLDKWGVDNNPVNSGPFQPTPEGVTTRSVNTVISTMASSNDLNSSFLFDKSEKGQFKGPDWGILSLHENQPQNYDYILNYADITISLNASVSGVTQQVNFLSQIDSKDIVVSFGSPTAAAVPEPATMLLFGTGLIGLAGLGRKKFRKK